MMRLDHLALNVSDPELVGNWYASVLGLEGANSRPTAVSG